MAIKPYTRALNVHSTPQTEPIPGSAQVENSAGGYSFEVDDWKRLDRFLILGTEGGSYYADERKLTIENAAAVQRCLKADGPRTVARIAEISSNGRAPKNDPAIFALALALKQGSDMTRAMARAAVPTVCRIGTHIFQFAESVKALGGWGRGTRHAFSVWYLSQQMDRLAMNLVKYQSRNGWSHRDVLRKAHVKPPDQAHTDLFRWAVGKKVEINPEVHKLVGAFEALKADPTVENACRAITEVGLPRECVPTELLNDVRVWDALLYGGKNEEGEGRGMPMTAMIRNLAKMTAVGLLKPNSEAARYITERLTDVESLRRARIHPVTILMALSTYQRGQGLKGSLTWAPVPRVIDALDTGFVLAFANIVPTGKRWMLGVDVSGSMSGSYIAGTALTPAEGAAAMAMVTARTEEQYAVMGFSNQFVDLGITAKTAMVDVLKRTRDANFGSTDCSLPIEYALQRKVAVDAFVVLTDGETYAGKRHPVQALKEYRQKTGIPAKLIVVGMVSNGFTIADPNDAGMLDVVGFDAAAPQVMADFAR